jgi:hypothetical protein
MGPKRCNNPRNGYEIFRNIKRNTGRDRCIHEVFARDGVQNFVIVRREITIMVLLYKT